MKQALTFHRCILSLNTGKVPVTTPDISIEAFENQRYAEALQALLDSIDKKLRTHSEQGKEDEFTICHGPVTIYVKLDQEKLTVRAPFLIVPDKHQLAMMRQVAVLNFNDLDLARLCLQGNQLCFEYNCPVAFSHPRKIYQVLEEICLTGSRYDYEFRNQFDAQRILSPHFVPYSAEITGYIYGAIQESGQECLHNLKFFESSRKFNDMWYLITITLLKIMYVARPQGKLYHTLQKAIRDMDRDIPVSLIIAKGKQALEDLLSMPEEVLAKSLYYTETFIPEKQYVHASDIREKYRNCYKQSSTQLEAGEYLKLCLQVTHKFYESNYKYDLPEDIRHLQETALEQASGHPLEKAASVLYDALETLMRNPVRTTPEPIIAA